MTQITEEVLNSQGIPGITPQDNDSPIAPPPGFVETVTQETQVETPVQEDTPATESAGDIILQRVRSAMAKFHEDMELMKQGVDPHPPVPVTVEEIDALLDDTNILIQTNPDIADLTAIKESLLQMRQDIVDEQLNMTQPEAAQVQQEEQSEADQAIAALNNEQENFMEATPSQVAEPAPQQEQAQPVQTFEAAPTFVEESITDMPDPLSAPAQQIAPPEGPREVGDTVEVEATVEDVDLDVDVEEALPEDTPAQVNQATVNNLASTLRRNQVGRVDVPTAPDGRALAKIQNRSLEYVLDEYFRTKEIPDEFEVNGTLLKEKSLTGIWEEGGATSTEGSVLLVTDPDGLKMVPVMVREHEESVNGKHALIRVWNDCYLVMGGYQLGRTLMTIYRITNAEVTKHPQSGKTIVELGSLLIGYGTDAKHITYEDAATPHDRQIWTIEAPAWKAAFHRVRERNAEAPIYTQKYREYYCDLQDISASMADQGFVAGMVAYADADKAYADIDQVLNQAMTGIKDRKKETPTLAIVLNYLPGHKVAVAYLIATIYNTQTKSSAGHRLRYGRIIINDSGSFRYPDVDAVRSVNFATLVNQLSRNGNSLACSFRKLTR